jgi:hypothetical protein
LGRAEGGWRVPETPAAQGRALNVLGGRFAVCRLAPDAPPPGWVFHAEAHVYSVTRTPGEMSVVCAEDDVPPSVERCERGWRLLLLEGPIPFEATGVLAALVGPLADAGVSVFALSTYDTDALLVREHQLERALEVLARTHRVTRDVL